MRSEASPRASPPAPPLIGAALFLMSFYLVGAVFLDGFALDLGSLNFPTPRYRNFVASYALLGGWASAFLALGAARYFGSRARADALIARWNAISERRFLTSAGAIAIGIPLVLRFGLLGGGAAHRRRECLSLRC